MREANQPNTPPVDRTVADIRRRVGQWRQAGDRVALVPTMGALHAGHIALVRAAGIEADRVVVSVFVNPTQFGPNEDLATYPRTWESDLETLTELAVDAVFAPTVDEVYPHGFCTSVAVAGPGLGLETDFRPEFLKGVATVVSKLLIACAPDVAIFGEKDYQQLLVIRRLVTDLGLPIAIAGHPTVREADGLALSSRNAYLSPHERDAAATLHASLQAAAVKIRDGAPVDAALGDARDKLTRSGFAIDYVELRNAETLAPVDERSVEPLRLLAAARLGRTRLIDNVAV